MGVAVDEVNNEIIVANNGDNSILVFPRTANGDVPPKRVIRGPLTGIKGPMGVAIAKDEIWVANFGDHTALVFPRLAAGNVGAAPHHPQRAGGQGDERVRQPVRGRLRHQAAGNPRPQLSQPAAHRGVCQAGKRKRGTGEGHSGAADASEPDDARHRV